MRGTRRPWPCGREYARRLSWDPNNGCTGQQISEMSYSHLSFCLHQRLTLTEKHFVSPERS